MLRIKATWNSYRVRHLTVPPTSSSIILSLTSGPPVTGSTILLLKRGLLNVLYLWFKYSFLLFFNLISIHPSSVATFPKKLFQSLQGASSILCSHITEYSIYVVIRKVAFSPLFILYYWINVYLLHWTVNIMRTETVSSCIVFLSSDFFILRYKSKCLVQINQC